jgi:hypothetical protein
VDSTIIGGKDHIQPLVLHINNKGGTRSRFTVICGGVSRPPIVVDM